MVKQIFLDNPFCQRCEVNFPKGTILLYDRDNLHQPYYLCTNCALNTNLIKEADKILYDSLSSEPSKPQLTDLFSDQSSDVNLTGPVSVTMSASQSPSLYYRTQKLNTAANIYGRKFTDTFLNSESTGFQVTSDNYSQINVPDAEEIEEIEEIALTKKFPERPYCIRCGELQAGSIVLFDDDGDGRCIFCAVDGDFITEKELEKFKQEELAKLENKVTDNYSKQCCTNFLDLLKGLSFEEQKERLKNLFSTMYNWESKELFSNLCEIMTSNVEQNVEEKAEEKSVIHSSGVVVQFMADNIVHHVLPVQAMSQLSHLFGAGHVKVSIGKVDDEFIVNRIWDEVIIDFGGWGGHAKKHWILYKVKLNNYDISGFNLILDYEKVECF